MIYNIPCVLFAGGKSSRMGEDKVLLPFGGYSTLGEFQYRRLQKIFSQVYISTKNPDKFPFEADFIIDESEVFAPTAGFVSIYRQLDAECFFVLGVDMPFVSEKVISALLEADSDEVDATLAQVDAEAESLCGIYHRSLQPHFEKMLRENRHKLRRLLEETNTQQITFTDKRAFLNLNRPSEYQKAKELYAIIS